MTARRSPLVLAVLVLVVLALPNSAATAPPPAPPDPTCSPGPSNCFAWHTANVTVKWASPPAGVNANGCGNVTISSDTGGQPVSCTWSNAEGSRTTTANVRRDATAPSVSVSPERPPDANGWYNRGLTIGFSGSDATSGVASCSSGGYSGPDTTKVSVSGSCTDNAGNTGSASVELKYDATSPRVEAKPNRPPDANGWYNHEVTVAFLGSDEFSGIDACAEPVLYKGPDVEKTTLSGTCRDKAANTSPPAGFELKYDSKPPALKGVKAAVGKRGVVLRWTASKDALSFTVVRRPGLRGKKPLTVYKGQARTFTDRRIEGGIKYRYAVTAYDQAGNSAVRGTFARLGPSSAKPAPARPRARPAVTRPADGARVAAPPLVAWGAAARATYYNFQLYRGGQKILSMWPSRPLFQLQASWRFEGRAYRLTPGRYTWYVWPGFGPRSAHRYGKLLAKREFVVTR